jgi:hypothetical protein
MSLHKILIVAALCALPALPASAKPEDRGPTPGLGWGPGGSRGAPVPLAGAGLPVLVLAGVYALMRHRRSSAKAGDPQITQRKV